MTQDNLILLLFKIVIVADLVTLAAFVAVYTRLAKWWANTIGRTIVIKDILLGAALTPSVLSLFLKFNRLTSHIAAWVDIALFAGIAAVMVWRCFVWGKLHRIGRLARDGSDEQAGS